VPLRLRQKIQAVPRQAKLREVNAVDVAVGVVVNANQHVLISKRAAYQHQGNRWEFPGGKKEPNETIAAALTRELFEELGLEVRNAEPLCTIEFEYPEKCVRLQVFWVFEFSGQVTSKEGQEWRWVAVHELGEYTFPDANAPIVDAIQARFQ